ncbi:MULTISPECIES: hypothetical protein [unclassified Arcicella]|uniref:hypothetical protein n=1 Tax=unclassified Arcicella TaxID=2644986 RepID=UPI00285B9AF8|nr:MULTISPECIES: hypothetical protein [unclassified Arcicella]MDR6563580.1 hypothetical protein [Arcicella sp. BE51]MDR6813308.1 hypothetical protein [Arcicella sp. BE140]MDR6824622.1 hypothetical protein [Arcicella sp. BE139]
MNDNLYARLYEIRYVSDDEVEEYKALVETMYNNRDSTTFRKFCSVVLDESPSGNTSDIHAMWREYVENYFDVRTDIRTYINELLSNADAFMPQAESILQASIIRILNKKENIPIFLEAIPTIYSEHRSNYIIIKKQIENIKSEDWKPFWLDTILESIP